MPKYYGINEIIHKILNTFTKYDLKLVKHLPNYVYIRLMI